MLDLIKEARSASSVSLSQQLLLGKEVLGLTALYFEMGGVAASTEELSSLLKKLDQEGKARLSEPFSHMQTQTEKAIKSAQKMITHLEAEKAKREKVLAAVKPKLELASDATTDVKIKFLENSLKAPREKLDNANAEKKVLQDLITWLRP